MINWLLCEADKVIIIISKIIFKSGKKMTFKGQITTPIVIKMISLLKRKW